MRAAVAVLTLSLLVPFTTLSAQELPLVKPGDRVRVTAPDFDINKYNGSLVSATRDTIVIDTLRIALASVTRLEVRRQKISRGALVALDAGGTAVGGALLGAGLGYLTFGETGAAYGATLVGGAGLVFGAVYGSFASIDRWEEVPLDRLRVSLVPQRNGRLALGMSWRY